MKKWINTCLAIVAVAAVTIVVINLPDKYYEIEDAKLYRKSEEFNYGIELNDEKMTLNQKLEAIAAEDTIVTMKEYKDDDEFIQSLTAHLDSLSEEAANILFYPNDVYTKWRIFNLNERIRQCKTKDIYTYGSMTDVDREKGYIIEYLGNETHESVHFNEFQVVRAVENKLYRLDVGALRYNIIDSKDYSVKYSLDIFFDVKDHKIFALYFSAMDEPLWQIKYKNMEIDRNNQTEREKCLQASREKMFEYYGAAVECFEVESVPGDVMIMPGMWFESSNGSAFNQITELMDRYGNYIVEPYGEIIQE